MLTTKAAARIVPRRGTRTRTWLTVKVRGRGVVRRTGEGSGRAGCCAGGALRAGGAAGGGVDRAGFTTAAGRGADPGADRGEPVGVGGAAGGVAGGWAVYISGRP